jgi:hypothetical protein
MGSLQAAENLQWGNGKFASSRKLELATNYVPWNDPRDEAKPHSPKFTRILSLIAFETLYCVIIRIIYSKISIWIQENFHYHVPILKSHHDPLPSLQRQFCQDKANQHKEYGTWHVFYETCTKSNKFYHWEGLCARERLVCMYSEHSKPWKGEITKLGEKWMN